MHPRWVYGSLVVVESNPPSLVRCSDLALAAKGDFYMLTCHSTTTVDRAIHVEAFGVEDREVSYISDWPCDADKLFYISLIFQDVCNYLAKVSLSAPNYLIRPFFFSIQTLHDDSILVHVELSPHVFCILGKLGFVLCFSWIMSILLE